MEIMMFCFIVEIEYIEIDVESVGIFVSADFFVGFYIHFHANGLPVVRCRSPPVNASFWFVLIGGFFVWIRIQKEESIEIILIL